MCKVQTPFYLAPMLEPRALGNKRSHAMTLKLAIVVYIQTCPKRIHKETIPWPVNCNFGECSTSFSAISEILEKTGSATKLHARKGHPFHVRAIVALNVPKVQADQRRGRPGLGKYGEIPHSLECEKEACHIQSTAIKTWGDLQTQ